jgi:D-amino-acid dehydrogenase
MLRKSGYHRHFTTEGTLNLPLADVASAALMAPMKAGLRIATGAEFVEFGSCATPVQLQRAESGAREILPLGQPIEHEPWHGYRPCAFRTCCQWSDGLPRHRGMWFNIGHGHQGFTLGLTTAELLAELFAGTPRDVDLLEKLSPRRLPGLSLPGQTCFTPPPGQ